MANFPVVKGVRLRATRVDACGMPLAGPRSRVITEGWIRLQLSPQMRDAQDIEQTNAEGRVCVSDRTPPERKWWNVTLELCEVNTCLMSMFTDWKVLTDWDGNDVGMADRKRVPSTTGVAIEVWSGVGSEDTCEVPENDDILTATGGSSLPYGYFLIPVVKEVQLGDIEIGATAATFTLTGITAAGARWGRGPYNVVATDSDNTAGRLPQALDNEQHVLWLKTTIAPPDASDDCCPLVLPTPYYGTLAVEIAPNQPACDAVGSNEVQTVTLTGNTSIAFQGQSTPALGVATTAAAFKTALEALSTIGVGNVDVTGGTPGGPFAVTFKGDLAEMNVPPLTAGTPANATIVQTTPGGVYP